MSTTKFRSQIISTGGIRVGDATNYTDIGTDGLITTSGSARNRKTIWIPAPNFYAWSGSAAGGGLVFESGSMVSGSLQISVGASIFADTVAASLGIPVLSPSVNATGSPTWANALFQVPTDRATSGSIEALAVWTSHDTQATAGSVFAIMAAVTYISSSAAVRQAASTGACATYNYTASGIWHETDLGDLPSFGTNDVAGICTIMHSQVPTEDTAGSSIAFAGVKLRYLSDRDGTQGN